MTTYEVRYEVTESTSEDGCPALRVTSLYGTTTYHRDPLGPWVKVCGPSQCADISYIRAQAA